MSSTSPTPPPAQIEYVREIPIIVVAGRLDTSKTKAFDDQVASLLTQPNPRILLDLHSLTFLGSLGLRSIFKLIKHAAVSSGRAAAFSVPPMVLEVLDIAGFTRLLDIYPDRETALSGGRS